MDPVEPSAFPPLPFSNLSDGQAVLIAVEVGQVVPQRTLVVDGVRELRRRTRRMRSQDARQPPSPPLPLTTQFRPRKGILLRDSFSSTGRRPTQPSNVR